MDTKHSELSEQYKFRAVKVFGSNESLANREKIYRLVYDESECRYIYCEFSFYNKLFDEEDWDITVNLKCINSQTSALICDQQVQQTVQKGENIVYIRQGWGNDTPGAFWRKGVYRWQVWINETFISETTFYIEKEGPVSGEGNPYINLKSVKFYEGPYDGVALADRTYLKVFDVSKARYIWAELCCENLVRHNDFWASEFQIHYRNSSDYLKGSVSQVNIIKAEQDVFYVVMGWGSAQTNYWTKDRYSLDVFFMGQRLATYGYEVGDSFVQATENDFKPLTQATVPVGYSSTEPPEDIIPKTLEEVMKELDDLIGLNSIKTKVKEYATYLDFLNVRKSKGIEETEGIKLHSVFTGNPGTGKTTVAQLLGKIYCFLGLLSKGTVLTVDRSDLVGPFIGQTAPRTRDIINKARGGILFIDEAYALAREDNEKDFGGEALEILMKEMSDGPGDIAIIAAGYPHEMQVFLDSNPGLKSRFQQYFTFPDYLPQDLILIADYGLNKRNLTIDREAREFLYTKLVEAYRSRDSSFGNARYVNMLLNESKINLGLRVMAHSDRENLTREELCTIQKGDIQKVFLAKAKTLPDIPVDEDFLKDSLSQLNAMIGLNSIKSDITEMVKLVRFYREIGQPIHQVFSFHSAFLGNPGTGKTTVARILAHILKALGILERGHLVECDKQALVAGYVGQTPIKTAALIETAIGGILFIDEAYSLAEGVENDFGKEALQTLLKRMEDKRGEFVVIVAGYTHKMENFLASNPGLKSRFDRFFTFPDFAPGELFEIALKMLRDKKIKATPEARLHLKNYLESLFSTKDDYFGNGRAVRRVIEAAIINQNLRLADLPAQERNQEMLETLILDDVKDFAVDLKTSGQRKKPIGFL